MAQEAGYTGRNTVTQLVQDDTLPGGPREKTFIHQASGVRCDRERDFEVVWREVARWVGVRGSLSSSRRGSWQKERVGIVRGRSVQTHGMEMGMHFVSAPADEPELEGGMKMSQKLRKIILATLALFCILNAPAWSQPAAPNSTEAERALGQAFETYCGTLGSPQPELCKGASSARQYLALEAVCPEGSSEPFCAKFAEAKTKPGRETLEPLVLELDHTTGRWHSRNRLEDVAATRVKLDVAGEPTVSLTKQERITVVVENTNPLLYGAVAGKPTEEEVPELASIQKLLGLLGGDIAAYLKVLGTGETARIASGEELEELKAYTAILRESAEDLGEILTEVECRTGQTAVQTSRAIAFIQDIELGFDGQYLLTPLSREQCPQVTRLITPEVAQAFAQLQAELFSPRNRPEDCADLLGAARDVLVADWTAPSKVREALAKFDQVTPGLCDQQQYEELKSTINEDVLVDVRDAFKYVDEAIAGMRAHAAQLVYLKGLDKPSPEQKQRLEELRAEEESALKVQWALPDIMRQLLGDEQGAVPILREASELGSDFVNIRKAAEEILAKRDEVQKAAAQVEVFERRLEKYRTAAYDDCLGEPCVNSTSLDLRLILEPQLKGVRQTKIQKHSLTVKPDSPYASKIIATRPAELKGAYNLDSALRGLWGISASVIYTDLASPTFGAVTSEDDPEKKVIAQTDETTRAGDIALLADFRLGRWLMCRKATSKCGSRANWFGVEFGAGVSDDPAFFAGLSFRPSRSWRVGVGYTYQQVKELADGFKLGQEIASADDIRTRDDFQGKVYLSLSFALDSLKLFSSGD